jgi:hypothetical protein
VNTKDNQYPPKEFIKPYRIDKRGNKVAEHPNRKDEQA